VTVESVNPIAGVVAIEAGAADREAAVIVVGADDILDGEERVADRVADVAEVVEEIHADGGGRVLVALGVGAVATVVGVPARPTVEGVVACAAEERIGTAGALQRVDTVETLDDIGIVIAEELVSMVRAADVLDAIERVADRVAKAAGIAGQ